MLKIQKRNERTNKRHSNHIYHWHELLAYLPTCLRRIPRTPLCAPSNVSFFEQENEQITSNVYICDAVILARFIHM